MNAWEFYGKEFATSNIPTTNKAMQAKLTNDNEFNINTMAVVLILKANTEKLIDKPSDISNLTEDQWKLVVGAYNANDPVKRTRYSDKVFEYRISIKEFLD